MLEQRQIAWIVIEFVDEEDIRIIALDDFRYDSGLSGDIALRQVFEQRTVGITIQRGVECGHTGPSQQQRGEAGGGDGDRKDQG